MVCFPSIEVKFIYLVFILVNRIFSLSIYCSAVAVLPEDYFLFYLCLIYLSLFSVIDLRYFWNESEAIHLLSSDSIYKLNTSYLFTVWLLFLSLFCLWSEISSFQRLCLAFHYRGSWNYLLFYCYSYYEAPEFIILLTHDYFSRLYLRSYINSFQRGYCLPSHRHIISFPLFNVILFLVSGRIIRWMGRYQSVY